MFKKNGVEMKAKQILFICISVILITTSTLIANDIAGRYGIGLFVSSLKMVGGKIDRSTIDQGTGFQFKFNHSQQITFGVSLAYGWVYPKVPDGSHFKSTGHYKTELVPFDLTFSYYFLSGTSMRPFMTLGTGFMVWDIRDLGTDVSTFSRGKSLNGGQLNASMIAGMGFDVFMSRDYVLSLCFNYRRLLKGDEDTIGYGDDGNNGVVELRLGLSRFFGGFKDQDGDGIEDKFDVDPLHPEDFDNYQDNDGAPDPDNDNDGILDIHDKAPNNPEDFDGFQDDDGVPDLDNDGDKIPDAKDKCPDKPEDFDEFEDQDGCPDFDNDKDGIPDSLDQCPNWAEDINGYADDDGCPDEKPASEPEPIEQGKSIVLKGVNFQSGSALLTRSSYPLLDEVVKTLSEHPHIEIEIRGYTDDVGNNISNQKLSDRRAHAVSKYLIEHGIDPRRLRSVGYGEQNPIASNSTPEGRAANRRIEFVRIK